MILSAALKQVAQHTKPEQTVQYNEFKHDMLDFLSRKNGGHVQKYIYGTMDRPYGYTGSDVWHAFVMGAKDYYPIKAETALIPELIKTLRNDNDTMVEFGVGDKKALLAKTMKIIESQLNLKHFYGFDISQENLDKAREILAERSPELTVHNICDDFYKATAGVKGSLALGSFLGTTISQQNMMIGGEFPRNELVSNLKKLVADSKGKDGGSLVFSFDSNEDWEHVRKAYSHHYFGMLITGIMHDMGTILKPEGNFNPSAWRHVQVVDKANYVMHQCITPTVDQHFKIDGHEFDIKKDAPPLVVNNNFKIPLDVMLDIVDEAGAECVSDPVNSDEHPMVMLEVA